MHYLDIVAAAALAWAPRLIWWGGKIFVAWYAAKAKETPSKADDAVATELSKAFDANKPKDSI